MPLNICMLSLHSSPIGQIGTRDTGGMSVYIRELARQMGARGHRVDIYTCVPSATADGTTTILAQNVRLIHLNGKYVNDQHKSGLYESVPAVAHRLDQVVSAERIRYDVLHSHYWLSGCLGNWAQKHWRIPHMLTFHTLGAVKNLFGKRAPEPEIRIKTETALAHASDRILVAAERERTHLAVHYGIAAEKVALVPCGVNLEHFYPIDKQQARRQLGLPGRRATVLYVGRFDPLKRIDRLIEAHALLNKHHPTRLLLIGGDGPQHAETNRLQQLCRRLGTQTRVTFVGRIDHDHLLPYYNAADVLVLPSQYESFGLVGLEALACGTPVVSTPVGAMGTIIQNGVNGRVLSDASPAGIAEGIEPFVIHPETDRDAHRNRAGVINYGWGKVADAVIDEYNRMSTPNSVAHPQSTATDFRVC